MRVLSILAGLLLAATVYGQSIVTPVFVHKDGEASASGYTGSEKDIFVDGGLQQVVGWVTFQAEGVDVSKVATAKLTLYVKTLTAPGTLGVYALTAPITAPENNVPLSLLKIGTTALASVTISTSEVEKMLLLDITAAVKSGTFYGIALKSEDGLQASFDSKEGNLDPVILLTHNVDNVAAKWLSGATVPDAGLGKDGDYYLNTASGDVSAKTGGAWAVVTNIVGAPGVTGAKGDKGDAGTNGTNGIDGIPGAKGDKGDKGDTGEKGEIGATGSKGDQGIQGIQGIQGVQGATGSTGATGAKGDKGDQGAFPTGTAAGDMQYWNGMQWVMIPIGQPGQSLNVTGSSIPQWSTIPGTVSDIDGNVYRTIVIGNQEWTLTNLKTTKLNEGTAIPNVTGNTEWGALTTPGYCWYNNDFANKEKYGALYNWYTVNTGKLAPAGWRVPETTDWIKLEIYLIANGYNYDGTTTGNKIAKSMAAMVWTSSTNVGAIGNNLIINNKSGFSALPGGYRLYLGNFYLQSSYGSWWSATEHDATSAWYRLLLCVNDYLYRVNDNKSCGFSVRLVKDLN
jgi:uncharacterized protein (TIGR02145 family)